MAIKRLKGGSREAEGRRDIGLGLVDILFYVLKQFNLRTKLSSLLDRLASPPW